MAAYQTEVEVSALIRSFRYEMPQGELPSPEEAAPIIREAGLFSQLEALTRWVEPRADATSTGVLRPEVARKAYEDLGGLAAWTRESVRLRYDFDGSRIKAEDLEGVLDRLTVPSWRSARDCEALDRLWNAALSCQVIRIEGRWAYASWPEPLDDEGTVNLGIVAGFDLLYSYLDNEPYFGFPVLGYALLRSYVRRTRPVPLQEIADFAESWLFAPSERAGPDSHLYRRLLSESVHRALFSFGDLGIFSQRENEITLTSWGDVFVSAWLSEEVRDL
jgi:hypothetical protein